MLRPGRDSMKKVFALFTALLICIFCAASVAAATTQATAGDPGVVLSDNALTEDSVQHDGIVEEKDLVIDLNLTTTLIVSICSVITIGLIVLTVYLAKKNKNA